MALDLFSMVLSGAVSWSVGKIIDVGIRCWQCGEKWDDKIGNAQFNDLGCKNCWTQNRQFTNACDFTVNNEFEIAQTAFKFNGNWKWNYDPTEKSLFKTKYKDFIFFPGQMRILGLENKQIVIEANISEFESGIVHAKMQKIFVPDTYDFYNDKVCLDLNTEDLPNKIKDDRIIAVEIKILSKYNDLLCKDRLLGNFWK